MAQYAKPLSVLIDELASLPGIGGKSAQRLAFHILSMNEEDVKVLAETIINAKRKMKRCSICGNLTDINPCGICTDNKRNTKTICVVESPKDVAAMERIKEFNGRYHVLHGCISPMDGIGPEDINLHSFLKRLQTEDVDEVILATNPTIEGEATAMYIARLIKPAGIKVSRIAHGLPVGGDLEYADEVTISKSLENRKEL